jgi:hypothetical protein
LVGQTIVQKKKPTEVSELVPAARPPAPPALQRRRLRLDQELAEHRLYAAAVVRPAGLQGDQCMGHQSATGCGNRLIREQDLVV